MSPEHVNGWIRAAFEHARREMGLGEGGRLIEIQFDHALNILWVTFTDRVGLWCSIHAKKATRRESISWDRTDD